MRIHFQARIKHLRDVCHLRYLLENNSIVYSLISCLSPGKRSMVTRESCRSMHRIHLLESISYLLACVSLICGLYFISRNFISTRHIAMECIRMSRTYVWNRQTGLCPCGSISGMRVHNASDFRESLVKHQMRRHI